MRSVPGIRAHVHRVLQHPDIVFGKVDTEAQEQLAAAAVEAIPTLMAFKKGHLVFSQAGALPPAALEDLINQIRDLVVDAAVAARPRPRRSDPVHAVAIPVSESIGPVGPTQPGVVRVTLNRPERMNSMAFDVMVPLRATLALHRDNDVRVVVLTGAGRGFSSGADHKSAGAVPHVEGLTRPSYALRSMELLDDVVPGYATPAPADHRGRQRSGDRRGGLCLALAADIRVASEAAYFRAAGINSGLTASELGLNCLLPRVSAVPGRSRSC